MKCRWRGGIYAHIYTFRRASGRLPPEASHEIVLKTFAENSGGRFTWQQMYDQAVAAAADMLASSDTPEEAIDGLACGEELEQIFARRAPTSGARRARCCI